MRTIKYYSAKIFLYASFLFFLSTIGLVVIYVDLPRIIKSQGYTSASVSKVSFPAVGVLTMLSVSDRNSVVKGDVLAEVSAERYTQGRNLDLNQEKLIKQKLLLGEQELNNGAVFDDVTRKATQLKIQSIQFELEKLDQALVLSQSRLSDLERQLARQKELLAQGFVSSEAVEQKRGDVVAQTLAISALQRNKLQLVRDADGLRQELLLISSRTQTQRNLLLREIAVAQQELNEQGSHKMQVIAPMSGVVTQISAAQGQLVRPDVPLLTIVPSDSVTEVILLIPSRSIGFVRVGQKVSVRYDAYPHSHYGRHIGIVKEVARAALPPQDVVQHLKVAEPVYTVRVSLPANYLPFQGKQLPITPGMVVEADVELDRLKIYQWLLEPMYRLGGRI